MTDIQKMESPQRQIAPDDPMVSMIERIVMDPNADLDKLERMLAMKERMDQKAARAAFDRAIAEAKAKIPPILKTGTVDYTNAKNERTYFKHETLDGIAKVVDPILSEHGLSYRYRSHQENGQLFVTCVVSHRDGCSEETTLQGGPDAGAGKNNYQAIGSAATYLQRYTLKLALGLSAAKDDDGNEATTDPELITEDQFHELRDLIEKAGITEDVVCQAEKIAALHELPAARFEGTRKRLNATIKNRGAK